MSTFALAVPILPSTYLTSSGGRALIGEQPTLSAPLAPAPTLVPAPILGPAITRPFLPNSPTVYDGGTAGPAIIAPIRPTGYPTVTNSGVDTAPAPPIVQPPAPTLPQRPRVLPGPSQPLPTPPTVTPAPPTGTAPGATKTPLELLKAAPWWGVAAGLVALAVLFSPQSHAAAAG